PLPRFPRCIGIVTSATGAAIRDMLRIIPRRWPAVDIVLYPVLVQGDGAAKEIATAIRHFNHWRCADVLIVGRGGGSIEDLWAFNEEMVAEAIFRSVIPVISAVGHETDFTIADFVADHRAATPSEAAELVVPDFQECRKELAGAERQISSLITKRVNQAQERLQALRERRVLKQPLERIRTLQQRVDELATRVQRAARLHMERQAQRL